MKNATTVQARPAEPEPDRDNDPESKGKPVNYQVIARFTEDRTVAEPYQLLDRAQTKWHPHLNHAAIALAWRKNWEPDQDGRVILGQCKKVGDLEKEFHDYVVELLEAADFWSGDLADRRAEINDFYAALAAEVSAPEA
jgi:hypothetical protein